MAAEQGAGGDRPHEGGAAGGGWGWDGPPGAPNSEESGGRTGTSTEQILQTGNVLLHAFIADRVQRTPDGPQADVPELSWTHLPIDPATKELSECLRKIGDELDGNMELQRMIDQVKINSPKEVFFKVAMEMFADGNFNWGRVVALFYFACKLVLKALWTKVPNMIQTLITWTIDFLREYVVQWIREQGGWEGLISYVSTPSWQAVSVFLAGVITASITIWKMS
ncbi:apoptosis regulator BAX [Spea bombifrons]|uniref:apoptosis regulator BAX n=1 Tax=Spea bombifrons TaxID=233779 RepID=UPI002348F7F3|nr:apoptosis regulator BAX [Spea bombifrons]